MLTLYISYEFKFANGLHENSSSFWEKIKVDGGNVDF